MVDEGRARTRVDEWAQPSPSPQTWLFLAAESSAVTPHLESIAALAKGRHRILVGFLDGPRPEGLPRPVERRRLSAALRVRPRLRGPVRGVLDRLPAARRFRAATRHDPWLTAEATRADHVVRLDLLAEGAAPQLVRLAPRAGHWPAGSLADLVTEEGHWRYLDHRVRRLAGVDEQAAALPMKGLARTLTWLRDQPRRRLGPQSDYRPAARELAHRLIRRGRPLQARNALAAADLVHTAFPGDDAEIAPLRAVATYLQIDADGKVPAELSNLLGRVFRSADAALADADLHLAAGRVAVGLQLMFHPRLHTDTPSTPLVESPSEFLRPFTASEVGHLLTTSAPAPAGTAAPTPAAGTAGPAPAAPTAGPAPAAPRGSRPRVVVLPGSYPWHAETLVAALAATSGPEVAEVHLDPGRTRGMVLDSGFVRHRLARGLGAASDVDLGLTDEQREVLWSADVVFADWADRGAVWASTELPPRVRLVVRVHSVDVLSPGLHLVDWGRVSDLVVVSAHLGDVVRGLLGDRLRDTRIHVIPNIVAERALAPAPDDGHVLSMVGWGQRVKDPLMAVEILAALRAEDPAWRLRLIGPRLSRSKSGPVDAYTLAFRERLRAPDVADAVELVGRTDDVAGHLAGSGFVLSTSLRESFHLGVMEGIQAGAFPVVREWPAYARHRGAARLFPQDCVVGSVAEAADLIRRLSDPEARRPAVARVQAEMGEILRGGDAVRRLVELLLG